MLTVLSPAKSLDFETRVSRRLLPRARLTQPDFLNETSELVSRMQKASPRELIRLMNISQSLAELNVSRYASFCLPFSADNAKPAAYAFRGDVYLGLEIDSFDRRDLNFAEKHLRIVSGLYGLLRPLDLIQPYRLEMGTDLDTRRGKNLYEFWGSRLTEALSEQLLVQKNRTLINLASNEYFRAIQPDQLPGRVITPVFMDKKKGEYRVISFFAKRARGMMARYMVQQRIDRPGGLKAFNLGGYAWSARASSGDRWVFLRDEQQPEEPLPGEARQTA